MAIDNSVRWLRRVTLAVAVVMIGWGSSIVLGQPVTAWFATSAAIWMALLLISALWQLRGSFTAITALALAAAVVARLFSILRLHPPADLAGLRPDDLDLLVATGPGVPGFELLGWFLGALVLVQFVTESVAACKRHALRWLDVGRQNDVAPLPGLVGDELREIAGRACEHCPLDWRAARRNWNLQCWRDGFSGRARAAGPPDAVVPGKPT